ncbi:methylenetetrahydrofolate reductase [Caldinitratiruptor microaerophilus]|uniref:Methylenetetrahydrofolate reductase n=1 Tax=Caldinitratiruptor microaerophilus TaxID=671077 RepID=A0AA35CNU5_9FIRM|nr:methylenetetrahydrofolate reductase [Caldinitratiruptor microaerophilus]BDG61032.1 hypothetical protein caldi_21220 [Caldinitratiruptor microaerophilus]
MARLLHRLQQREFTVTVEVDPPRGPDPAEAVAFVRLFADRVDAVNVADCPMASVRMSPITLAHLLQRDLQVECIFHLTCRDRNLIGLQAELLGAAGLGVRNILALRGDDPERGDQPDAAGVFQCDAAGLVAIAANLNRGYTVAGRELGGRTGFAIGVATSPASDDPAREVDRLLAKVEAGAHFAQTQPVYDPAVVERFQEHLARRGLENFPILYGIMPLKSYRNALYLARNVPGVRIPPRVLERMERGDRDEGVRIAAEVIAAIAPRVHGVHLFPMNSARLVLGLLDRMEEMGLRRSHPALRAAVGGATA